jgi:hypothetical protein
MTSGAPATGNDKHTIRHYEAKSRRKETVINPSAIKSSAASDRGIIMNNFYRPLCRLRQEKRPQ